MVDPAGLGDNNQWLITNVSLADSWLVLGGWAPSNTGDTDGCTPGLIQPSAMSTFEYQQALCLVNINKKCLIMVVNIRKIHKIIATCGDFCLSNSQMVGPWNPIVMYGSGFVAQCCSYSWIFFWTMNCLKVIFCTFEHTPNGQVTFHSDLQRLTLDD